MDRETLQVLLPVIAPSVTAALTVVGIQAREWRQRRDRGLLRQRLLDRAKSEVDFVDSWRATYERLSGEPIADSVRGRAESALNKAFATFSAAQPVPILAYSPLTPRRLLLLERFRSRSARLVRLVFYAGLAWCTALSGLVLYMLVDNEFSVGFLGLIVVVFTVFALVPTVAARELARRIEDAAAAAVHSEVAPEHTSTS